MMASQNGQARCKMPGILSTADVARLLSDPSPEARAELAAKLGLELSGSALAVGELAIAQDIVRLLARDVEAAVRASLSQSLRHAKDLPRDVALRMANDIEQVALPILSDSLVLTDEDLIELVRGGSARKQELIAARPVLSEQVSDAVIVLGHETAVAVLMANPTALVTEASLERAVDRFANSDLVKESMVARSTLPMTVAERLAVLVSRRLQDRLVQHHALAPSTAADLVMRGREEAIIRLSAGSDEPDLARMVAQMHHSRRLTPSLLLRGLCTGDIAFFEAAMAEMAGISVQNARLLIHDPGESGMRSLYRKAGLPDELYPMMRTAVCVIDETGFDGQARDLERFRARVIARVLTQFESSELSDVDYLVDKLGDVLEPV